MTASELLLKELMVRVIRIETRIAKLMLHEGLQPSGKTTQPMKD
jgi:hypothetical protein